MQNNNETDTSLSTEEAGGVTTSTEASGAAAPKATKKKASKKKAGKKKVSKKVGKKKASKKKAAKKKASKKKASKKKASKKKASKKKASKKVGKKKASKKKASKKRSRKAAAAAAGSPWERFARAAEELREAALELAEREAAQGRKALDELVGATRSKLSDIEAMAERGIARLIGK